MAKKLSHLERFIAANRHLVRLKGSKNEELIRWAEEHRFINIIRFEKIELYDNKMVETAQMWKDKYDAGINISY